MGRERRGRRHGIDFYQQEQFLDIAKQIAQSLPGGCEVYIDPSGYTIQDRERLKHARAQSGKVSVA